MQNAAPQHAVEPSLRDLTFYSCDSAPSASAVRSRYMQKDLVEERRWFSKEDYVEGLALARLAPGPLAAQLAIDEGCARGAALLGSCTSAVPASVEPPRSQAVTTVPGAPTMSNTAALAGKHDSPRASGCSSWNTYEHSYHIDFGAAVPRYMDAFLANVNWEKVNRRFERAQRMSAVYRGAPS